MLAYMLALWTLPLHYANSLATIACLTTIAHLASITSSPAFANPQSPSLPHPKSAAGVYFSLIAIPHTLQITLRLLYRLKCHLSCPVDQWMAAGLGEGRRKGGRCGGLSRYGRCSGHIRCGKCGSRLSSPISVISPPSRSLQPSPSCVPVLSSQTSSLSTGILSKLMLLLS